MSGSGEDGPRRFDVAVNQRPPTQGVVEAAPEDEKKRDGALASTFDPALAHDGKTEEQLIEERQAGDRLLLDAAIAAGVVITIAMAGEEAEIAPLDDPLDEEIAPTGEEGGSD